MSSEDSGFTSPDPKPQPGGDHHFGGGFGGGPKGPKGGDERKHGPVPRSADAV